MSLLKIARMGHPVLRATALAVADPTTPEIRQLLADMAETLADAGGAGLAAPQVHQSLRAILFRVPAERAGPDEPALDLTALINPEWAPESDHQVLGWEGCLSIPGLRAAVPRYHRIRYRGWTPEGQAVDAVATGFHARVVQHEIDHLDGILYFERMRDLRLLSFVEESQRDPIDLAAEGAPS